MAPRPSPANSGAVLKFAFVLLSNRSQSAGAPISASAPSNLKSLASLFRRHPISPDAAKYSPFYFSRRNKFRTACASSTKSSQYLDGRDWSRHLVL